MEHLLRSIVDIGSQLDLDATLQRVTAATEVTGARHGALGVRGPRGGLAWFVHTGMDPEMVHPIGQAPARQGLLGLLLQLREPLRLDDLTAPGGGRAARGFRACGSSSRADQDPRQAVRQPVSGR
jgi:hypothetical protein